MDSEELGRLIADFDFAEVDRDLTEINFERTCCARTLEVEVIAPLTEDFEPDDADHATNLGLVGNLDEESALGRDDALGEIE